MSATPLYLLVRMVALPGRADALRHVLRALVEPTRGEDGCLRYDLLEEDGDEPAFLFVETWRDADALAAHGTSAHVRAARARYPELLAGSPVVHRAHALA